VQPLPPAAVPQPQGNTIEFSNISHYDIDIQPTGVYLTIHTDQATHTIKANVKPHIASQVTAQASTTVAPGVSAKKKPEIMVVQRTTNNQSNSGKSIYNTNNNRWSKLTEDQVAEIKGIWPEIYNEYKSIRKATMFLSDIYNCTSANIEMIVKGRTWRHVQPKKD
jgi:hypothetical protein